MTNDSGLTTEGNKVEIATGFTLAMTILLYPASLSARRRLKSVDIAAGFALAMTIDR